MSEDVKGSIGVGGPSYEITVDNLLNVSVSVKASAPAGTALVGSSLCLVASMPLAAILDAAASASKNAGVIMAEGFVKEAIEAYEASKVAAAAVVAPA